MGENIGELERRYQMLLNDFRVGKIDETSFISEVDRLQFADEWGRYWMIGSESGAWHYYDGNAWHQADPHERDKLPFIDDQGRYWQKGARSNDWYYFQPETNEWVKPGQGDPTGPASAQTRQWQPGYGHQQNTAASSEQFDTQLFQDDEGRYWTVGAKSGQWYFYDENGWHSAHEFQGGPMPQMPQPPAYQPQAAYYPPYQGMPPAQAYPPQPQQPNYQQPPGEPSAPTPAAQPDFAEPDPNQTPSPPQGTSQSGTWYYHDGNQWLKYATGEPAEETPPDPTKILDQDAKGSTIKVEEKDESMVAEFFDEDEPPVEVVDVEVITVIEAEPDEEEPEPHATSTPASSTRESVSSAGDEVRPRRSRSVSADETPAQAEPPSETQPQPRKRTPSDTGHPVKPRKRTTPHEPTIIIPTGSSASGIASPSSTRSRMPTRPIQPERRRVSEDATMEPVPPEARLESMSGSGRHQQVTQPLPAMTHAPAPSAEAARRARQPTRENVVSTSAPANQSFQQAQAQPDRPTFGDVLRTLPGTLWVWVAGTAVLLIAAILIVVVFRYVGDLFGVSTVASGQSPTPTLEGSIALDATPTPGPAPTTEPEPIATTPAALSVIPFSSPPLGISVEYPEVWYREEGTNRVIFSPSTEGLNPNEWQDTSLRIGMGANENSSISDLLTSALTAFPPNAEKLNEGTISIASQTWTSTQIQFDDENLGGQGISTIAVTNKDGVGHYLIAVAPAEEWNSMQPIFQKIIDSFRFEVEDQLAQTTADTLSSSAATDTGNTGQAAVTATPELEPTPPSTAGLDPVVHVVQSGDTLLGIANQYGVDVVLLASENGITDPGSLSIGQELTIPFTEEQIREYYQNGGTSAATADTSASEESAESAAEDSTEAESVAETSEASPESETAPQEAPPPPSEAAPLTGKIIYPAYNPGSSTYDLWIANVATGEQSGFMGNASQPSFNRDGSLLAFRSWDLGTRGVFFQDFVGGRGGKVTNFVEDGMPAWAPDGFTFAFASRKEGDRVPRLYIGNQLGEETIGLSFQGEYPSILPDGRIIAKGCTPAGDCGIFVMGPRGGGETKISDDPADTAPAPSPDGSKIVFMSIGRGATNWEIWVMNADGTNPQRLTENGNNDGLPTWSPDGQSIAYVSDQGGIWAIWVMNADGSNQRKLLDMKGSPDGIVLHDEPNSKGWLEERISWAP